MRTFSLSRFILIIILLLPFVGFAQEDSSASSENTPESAQTDPTSSSTPSSTDTSEPFDSVAFRKSILSFQAGVFREDVVRQIKEHILPVQVGEYALQSIMGKSLLGVNQGQVTFIAPAQGNSRLFTLYQRLARIFNEHGFTTSVVLVPLGLTTPQALTDAAKEWEAPLAAIHQAKSSDAPIKLVVSQGQIAATLLTLYKEGKVQAPNALIMHDVFFSAYEDNQTIPDLIRQQPMPMLDFTSHSDSVWSQQTKRARQFAGKVRQNGTYRQRRILGQDMSPKQAHYIHKEIRGWIRSLGWI